MVRFQGSLCPQRLSGAFLQRSHCMNEATAQRAGHRSGAAGAERTMDGNRCAPGVSAMSPGESRMCNGMNACAGRHATLLLHSGTFSQKRRDVQQGSYPSHMADHKRCCNEFAPVLQSLVSDAHGTMPMGTFHHHCCN
jgi:hypothetical protein